MRMSLDGCFTHDCFGTNADNAAKMLRKTTDLGIPDETPKQNSKLQPSVL